MLFLPIFRWQGHRWRVRLRLWRGWDWRVNLAVYPQGVVWQVWRGPLLITAMVDP